MLSNRNQETTKRRGNIFFIAWFSEISILRSDRPNFSYRHPYFLLIPEIYYNFPSTQWLYILCFNYLYWFSFLNIRSQDWSFGHQVQIREWQPLHQDWIGEIHNTYKVQVTRGMTSISRPSILHDPSCIKNDIFHPSPTWFYPHSSIYMPCGTIKCLHILTRNCISVILPFIIIQHIT